MAINKRAKNITINVRNTHTTICGKLEIVADSITITSTKENLVLASNKKIIAEGKEGGIRFGEYIPLSPNIVKVKWMDENQENEVDNVEVNQKVFLYVETEEKKDGIDVSISVTTSDNSEVVLDGITEEDGIAKIEWTYV